MHSKQTKQRPASLRARSWGGLWIGVIALLAAACTSEPRGPADRAPATAAAAPEPAGLDDGAPVTASAPAEPVGAAEGTPELRGPAPAPWKPADGVPAIDLILERGAHSDWHAKLVNRDTRVVEIVLPGDGSRLGLRSPLVRWDVMTDGGPFVQSPVGCGNYNPLALDGVVALSPGDSVSFDGYGVPYVRLPEHGIVTLRLIYEHDPEMEWDDGALGPHDAPTMARVRASAPLSLHSNAVRVELEERRVVRVLDQ